MQKTNTDIEVRLDERVRLVAAVLAATNFPEESQRLKPHGTHAHARATRKLLNEHSGHPAAKSTQAMLDQGAPLEALYTLALTYQWPTLTPMVQVPAWAPPDWHVQLRDFYEKAGLEDWWQKENQHWEKARAQCANVFQTALYKPYLHPFFGDVADQLVFIPNVSYPTDREVGARALGELVCIAPPPMAWGDSPPWPYDEETMVMHAFKTSLVQYSRILLLTMLRANPERVSAAAQTALPVNDQFRAAHPSWEDQFTELFVTALVAMYLEEFVSDAEYKSFVLMEKRVRGMNILPGTVSVLRRYLQERGNKYETLMDFLPLFPKQLRVAKRIVTL